MAQIGDRPHKRQPNEPCAMKGVAEIRYCQVLSCRDPEVRLSVS